MFVQPSSDKIWTEPEESSFSPESIDILGAASLRRDCILLASLMMCSGGLAQNTRQFLGSVKPGSMLGFSSLSRKGSMRTSLKSVDKNLSFC